MLPLSSFRLDDMTDPTNQRRACEALNQSESSNISVSESDSREASEELPLNIFDFSLPTDIFWGKL